MEDVYVVIDVFDKGFYVCVILEEWKIIGYFFWYFRGKLKNFWNYFVMIVDCDFILVEVWNGEQMVFGKMEFFVDYMGVIVGFRIGKGDCVYFCVVSFFISMEQVELNLLCEQVGKNFDELRNEVIK